MWQLSVRVPMESVYLAVPGCRHCYDETNVNKLKRINSTMASQLHCLYKLHQIVGHSKVIPKENILYKLIIYFEIFYTSDLDVNDTHSVQVI